MSSLPLRWLKMWATISLCVYGIGTPAMFLVVLVHYRREIKVDQVLRKTGLGYTRASNPHFAMRRRYLLHPRALLAFVCVCGASCIDGILLSRTLIVLLVCVCVCRLSCTHVLPHV